MTTKPLTPTLNGPVQQLDLDASGELQTFRVAPGDDFNLELKFNYSVDYYQALTALPPRVVNLNKPVIVDPGETSGGETITQIYVWTAAQLGAVPHPVRIEIGSMRGYKFPIEVVIASKNS